MADSIIQQLVHRKMFRITAGYLAVAWVLWQVVDTTCPTFECSLSFQKSIFWFLIAGLPITLAIAWVHWQTAIVAGIGILAGATVMFFVMRGPVIEPEAIATTAPVEVAPPAPAAAEIVQAKSIAVLPFADMSAAGDQGYFGDGVAEEILNGLTQVKALRVTARTSSFYFKGKDVQLTEIGETLNVNHVLEGSVRKAGNRLRITAQLVKIDGGLQLWSESYDSELTDIFAVQDEIAKAVVDALKVELGVEAGTTLVDIGTNNREAYDWYLRGKDAVFAGTVAGYEQGIGHLKRAIAIDSRYANAHAFLAYAHTMQHPFIPYRTLAPAIKQAYSRALEVSPSHSGALCAKVYDIVFSDWDWATAGKVFRAATEGRTINDICVQIALWYLDPIGRYNEGIELMRKAELEDPLNPRVETTLNRMFRGTGEREAGQRVLLAAVDIETHFYYTHMGLAVSAT